MSCGNTKPFHILSKFLGIWGWGILIMISCLKVLLLTFSDIYSAFTPHQLRYEGSKPLSQVSLKNHIRHYQWSWRKVKGSLHYRISNNFRINASLSSNLLTRLFLTHPGIFFLPATSPMVPLSPVSFHWLFPASLSYLSVFIFWTQSHVGISFLAWVPADTMKITLSLTKALF